MCPLILVFLIYGQIESLDTKLQHSRDELREKEFELLQRDQEINQLKKEIERKQHRLTGIEKVRCFLG